MIDVGALYAQYRAPLLRFLERRVPSREVAEDLVGQVFERALTGPYEERGEGRAWLYRIARNLLTDWYRRQAVERRHAPVLAEDDASDSGAILTIDRESIEWVIDRLTPEQQRVIRAVYLEDRSIAEVAAVEGRKRNTISHRLMRARRSMRRLLREPRPEHRVTTHRSRLTTNEMTTFVPAEVCLVCGSQRTAHVREVLHCGGCWRRIVRAA